MLKYLPDTKFPVSRYKSGGETIQPPPPPPPPKKKKKKKKKKARQNSPEPSTCGLRVGMNQVQFIFQPTKQAFNIVYLVNQINQAVSVSPLPPPHSNTITH